MGLARSSWLLDCRLVAFVVKRALMEALRAMFMADGCRSWRLTATSRFEQSYTNTCARGGPYADRALSSAGIGTVAPLDSVDEIAAGITHHKPCLTAPTALEATAAVASRPSTSRRLPTRFLIALCITANASRFTASSH